MSSLTFYSVLDDEIYENAGIQEPGYSVSYRTDASEKLLALTGNNPLKVTDPDDMWRIETDGLILSSEVTIEYPDQLYGPSGIACTDARLGMAQVWTVPSMKRIGFVQPSVSQEGSAVKHLFEIDIPPNSINGDIRLETILYIKDPAVSPTADEGLLINEAGVSVGTIDSVTIKVTNNDMLFPIKEYNDKDEPLLWSLDLSNLEDPSSDPFDESTLCLWLNKAHPAFPVLQKNPRDELMVEILGSAYLMLFLEISRLEDGLDKMINNIDLEPGSVSMVAHYFWEGCDPALVQEPIDVLEERIRLNLRRMIGDK